eukprot:6243859-Alexandrium_andersonii.AAC.1
MLRLIEHAGALLTEHTVGHDGRTPYERLFGTQCREGGYACGELVHYRVRPTEPERSLDARWENGIWLGRWRGTGVARRSGQFPRGS